MCIFYNLFITFKKNFNIPSTRQKVTSYMGGIFCSIVSKTFSVFNSYLTIFPVDPMHVIWVLQYVQLPCISNLFVFIYIFIYLLLWVFSFFFLCVYLQKSNILGESNIAWKNSVIIAENEFRMIDLQEVMRLIWRFI